MCPFEHLFYFLMVIGAFQASVGSGTEVLNLQVSPSPKQAVGADVQVSANIRFSSITNVSITLDEEVVGQVQNQEPVVCSESLECPTPDTYSQVIKLTLKNISANHNLLEIIDASGQQIQNTSLQPSFCTNLTEPGIEQNVPQNQGYLSIHKFTCSSGYVLTETTAICQANATWNVTLNCVKVCNNVTYPGVKQDVPPNQGYLSRHTFSCSSGYNPDETRGVCQKDGTWYPNLYCVKACNNLTRPDVQQNVPLNQGHFSAELVFCPPGSFPANFTICQANGTWAAFRHCVKETCNQTLIPLDPVLHNISSGVLPVGQSVHVPCTGGNAGWVIAHCDAPDQWTTPVVKCMAIGAWVGIGIGCLVFICLMIAIFCSLRRCSPNMVPHCCKVFLCKSDD